MTCKIEIRNLLTESQLPIWSYVYAKEIGIFTEEFRSLLIQTQDEITLDSFLSYMALGIKKRREAISRLEDIHTKFKSNIPSKNYRTQDDLKKYFRYLERMQGRKSCNFYRRYKWLDKTALEEKYNACISYFKKEINALFKLTPAVLHNTDHRVTNKNLLLELIKISTELLNTESIWQLKQSVLLFLRQIFLDYKSILSEGFVEELVSNILKIASDKREHCWVRSESLEVLSILSETHFLKIANDVILEQEKDTIFLKGKLVKLVVFLLNQSPSCLQILNSLIFDKSEFVRQSVAKNIPSVTLKYRLDILKLLINDEKRSVICQAVKSSFFILLKDDNPVIFEVLITKLKSVKNKDNIIFLINAFVEYFKELNKKDRINFFCKLKIVVPVLEGIRQDSLHIEVRRHSAMGLEQLWCLHSKQASELYTYILQQLEGQKTGKYIKLDRKIIFQYEEDIIGRVLSVISQEDFSIQFIKGSFNVKVVKDAFFKFRLWRALFEFRTPSPNKRQALRNSYGRYFYSRVRSASSIMAEKSETNVPGEPVLLKEEGSCRPYLPLLDDILSASDGSLDYKIFSPEGVTTIQTPRNVLKKIIAELKIILNFEKLATKRNFSTTGKTGSQIREYIASLKRTGYNISIVPYRSDEIFNPKLDSTVSRLFSLPLIFPSVYSRIFEDMKTYFFSIYLNTIPQLLFFTCAFIALFVTKHLLIHLSFQQARTSIPLVIGGWGTRGKSSTERLKAAIFSSLGCNVLSKTTGCQSAFLYAKPFEKLKEYPIFRPYEKTTIWEQHKLVRWASQLNINIFLWECMAISPRYVKLMQKDWMKDDFSTITNAYPDHENVQGPSGWNVAETMTHFIPEKAVLFTTEDQMYPFLKESARRRNTELVRLAPTDIMLIPDEIVNRFSYNEHPNNVALVIALAARLGIEKDYAMKEMCDNVIPDIGVLKKFKPLRINTKTLEFISGMSANEKYACMQNWIRMKMDMPDIEKDFGTVVSTVVNNRTDRVARSKVFAQIIAEELSVDYHFLVGTNLRGFLGYVEKAWASSFRNFSCTQREELIELFEQKVTFLRIPNKKNILENKLALMSNNSELTKFERPRFYERILKQYNEYVEFKQEIESSLLSIDILIEKCKILLTSWFSDKIVVLNDPKIRGEAIIKNIETKTPPFHKNIIMGIQNIKGPGIDLINAWEYLTSNAQCKTIDIPEHSSQSLLQRQSSRCFSLITSMIEPLAYILKQRKAKSIYAGIVSGSISSSKAIEELKKLTL